MKNGQLLMDLTDEQCEKVVGGVGRIVVGGPMPGAGLNGWGAPGTPSAGHGLINAGFSPPGVPMMAGSSGIHVGTPGDKA